MKPARVTGCATGSVTPTGVRYGMRYEMRDRLGAESVHIRTNAPLVRFASRPAPGFRLLPA